MISKSQYGDVSVLDTRTFVEAMTVGQEISVQLEKGKTLFIKLKHISNTNDMGTRDVTFDLHGLMRTIKVRDKKAGNAAKARHYIDWVIGHALPSGVLSEQVNPNDGAPVSVTPLVWSHAELINTILDISVTPDT